MMIDLRNVETFLWVAKLGGFRAAARKLNTTQPAVSMRIAALESELGVRLFFRGGHRVTMTPEAKGLLGYAERMVEAREEMKRAANQEVVASGQIRLGVSETLVHTWLTQLLERINKMFPLLALEIEVDITPNLAKALVDRSLDIAFLVGPVTNPEIKNIQLESYSLAWVASPKLRLPRGSVTLGKIAKWPIITYLRSTRPNIAILEMLAEQNITYGRIYASASISTMIPMILDGVGIGAIPTAVVARELRSGRLRKLRVSGAPLPELHFTAAHPIKPSNFVAAIIVDLARQVASRHGKRLD